MTELTDDEVMTKPPREMSDDEVMKAQEPAPTSGAPAYDNSMLDPNAIPPAFIDRMARGNAISRILSKASEGLSEGYGESTPTGLSDETLSGLMDLGIIHNPSQGYHGAAVPLQTTVENFGLPVAKLFDTVMRAANAGITGAGEAIGQLHTELGGSEGMSNRLRNEVVNAGNWAMIESGFGRFSRTKVGPDAAAVDQMIGSLPTPADFKTGAQVLGSDVAEAKLREAWQEQGIHPAEAVHDAQTDAFVRHDLTTKGESVAPTAELIENSPDAVPHSLGAAVNTEPPIVSLAEQPAPQPGRLAAAMQDGIDKLYDIGRDMQMLTAPMATGTTESMAIGKDFANTMRRNRWEWSRIDADVEKRFTPEQRARMFNAMDEESVAIQLGESREHQGLATLTTEERAAVQDLDDRQQLALLRAKDVGLYEGEGIPMHATRMVMNIANAADKDKALSLDAIGSNLKVNTPGLRFRKYMTVDETEAAAKAKFGEEAVVARDIRAVGLSTAHLEDAIAGRTLINNIKDYGKRAGSETVVEGAIPAGSDTKWFTLDHPAFKTWRPKMEMAPERVAGAAIRSAEGEVFSAINHADAGSALFKAGHTLARNEAGDGFITSTGRFITRDEALNMASKNEQLKNPEFMGPNSLVHARDITLADGAARVAKDAAGNPVFEQVPLYVHGDFEGPLRAVLTQRSGPLYSAAMNMKGKTMSLIMNSPLIHNAVEWGRALPAMPGKVASFKIYFEGSRAKHDVATMTEAIDNGLVPIGHRFFKQDITSIMESPNLTPGRSWTSQVLGFVPGLFDEAAGTAVKSAIDKAGDFWHNTLLWDRVGDLQAGLYTNFRDDLLAKGVDRQTSARAAAHFANRYAGALPVEAMSDAARKASNMLLFSRSFTMGNLGVIKDMFTGLPKDVMAQIERDAGFRAGAINEAGELSGPEAEVAKFAKTMARRKAISMVALDIGLFYVGNSVLQSALNVMFNDSTMDAEMHGYVQRLQEKMQATKEHPLSLLQPFNFFQDLSATKENEPGKQDRMLVGYAKDGTAIYARNPAGKIAEEFMGYMTGPLDMLRRKLGTVARPVWQIMSNDAGFGRKIYDPSADTPEKYLQNAGNIAMHFVKSQFPTGQLGAIHDLVTGEGDAKVNAMQAFGPVAGVTFSKGAPGGPAVGEMYANKSKFDYSVQAAMPDIRRQIQRGDVQGAQQAMSQLGMDAGYQRWVVKTAQNPATRLSAKSLRDFYRTASPEQRARMERLQASPGPLTPQ